MSGAPGRSGGHNRLSTDRKRKQGTLRKSRLRPNEPTPELCLPRAPAWLSKRGRRLYGALGALVLVARVCTTVDGEALALAAAALDEYMTADRLVRREGLVLKRDTEKGVTHYRHPAAIVRESAWRRYREALRAFGLDPQSRGTVSAVPEDDCADEAAYFQ